MEFVENNHCPVKIRLIMYLWVSRGAKATTRGQVQVPPEGLPLATAGARPCPVGRPSGCPPDSVFVSS